MSKEETEAFLRTYATDAEQELMEDLLDMEDHEDGELDRDCGESTTG